MFRCGSQGNIVCIPLMYKCDGVPDCESGDDEANCISPNTCQEWWDAGYRTNGKYKIGKYFNRLFI